MSTLAALIQNESLRHLRDGQERIHACVKRLNDEQLWHRPNANTVSVGNLVLHLTGNVGQWINSTLGARPDSGTGTANSRSKGRWTSACCCEQLDATLAHAYEVIRGLSAQDLERTWGVQGFRETGMAIVVHVVEHFSYHVGQITLHTKLLLDVDTGYYGGQDLNAKG